MQTIGKTTDEMDFPLHWTDILLKSISGKTNYTLDVKIGTKRIATDSQDPRENPKKRRKQSNPTRISSNEENINNGFITDPSSSDGNRNEFDHSEPETDLIATPHHLPTLPLNLTKSEIKNLSLNESQQVRLSNNTQQKNDTSAEVPTNLCSPYQPFTKTISYNFERKDLNYSIASSDGMITFKGQPGSSSANVGPVQIFNPEAYCDQCNKEFCNKYFLKTHKANKHGVFVDGHSNNSFSDQPDKNKPVQPFGDFSAKTNGIVAGASAPLSLFKNPTLFAQQLANANAYTAKNAINNQTRAFCNICHKEFCNKYFVRRHKAKIHGIADDGDGRTTNDDVPLDFKTSLLIKNEITDFAMSDACDRPEKMTSPPFQAQDGERIAADGSVAIKVERQTIDDELNAIAKLSGETYSDANSCFDGSEPTSASSAAHAVDANIADDHYEHAVAFPDEFSRAYAEQVARRLPDEFFDRQLGSAVGDSSFADGVPVPAGDADCGRDGRKEDTDVEATEANESRPGASSVFFKSEVDGWPTEKPRAREPTDECGGADAEHSCGGCRPTFGTGSVSHVERSAAGSKNSAEDDECRWPQPCTADRKTSAMLSSFCKICNKELCNKYFMKTHMQRMHGISIQNGDHIGGVVCDVCNKELCSKYFLRVHKQNSHGIVENGSCTVRPWPDSAADGGGHPPPTQSPPDESHDNNGHHRYYRHYTEVCAVCFRRFRSPKWLSAHLLNDHGDEGRAQWNHVQNHLAADEKKWAGGGDTVVDDGDRGPGPADESAGELSKQYRCSYCPFTTSVLSFLFVHEKFHTADNREASPRNSAQPERRSTRSPDAAVLDSDAAHRRPDAIHCPTATHYPSAAHCPTTVVHDLDAGRDPRNPENGDLSLDTNGNDVAFTAKLGAPTAAAFAERRRTPPEPANHEPFIMQSFFLENCSVSPGVETPSAGRSDSFHSSLVYLPVKEKLTSTVNVFFKLTPT